MTVACHFRASEPSPRSRTGIGAIFARHQQAYRAAYRPSYQQSRVIGAIAACRTAALGGHLQSCQDCGDATPVYNSCRNRHCPTCQRVKQAQWLAQREATILPTAYFHVVFTLPELLREVVRQNPRPLLALLMRCAADTLLTLGRDPKRLGAQLGITAVLHTWTRTLRYHPHVHCIVTGGGLSSDGRRWLVARQGFLFAVSVVRRLFRGRFMAALRRLFARHKLQLQGPLAELRQADSFRRFKERLYDQAWVVYAKQPFGGAEQVFAYLGRYTHRVGLTNARLREVTDSGVTFTTKQGRTTTLCPVAFMQRFLQHVLPSGFVKIRHYGLYASRHVVHRLAQARLILSADNAHWQPAVDDSPTAPAASCSDSGLWQTRLLVRRDRDMHPACRQCGSSRVLQSALVGANTS